MKLCVWTHGGDYLLFEKEIVNYSEYETEYYPHLQHCFVEIWDGDVLKYDIQLGYGG